MTSGKRYRDVFFDPDFLFIRLVAFFAGFFLAALAMIPPPFKDKLVSNTIQVYRQLSEIPEENFSYSEMRLWGRSPGEEGF